MFKRLRSREKLQEVAVGQGKLPHDPKHDELLLLARYEGALKRHGVEQEFISKLDLSNAFYWLFHLEGKLAEAHKIFASINNKYFEDKLITPRIAYCARATGGYYNPMKHLIAISLPMTIEFGEKEFLETLLHEIAHIRVRKHSESFYSLLRSIGGTGQKAPMTELLKAKRSSYVVNNYPIVVFCPGCKGERRYKTKRALHYACKQCCDKYAAGRFDARFKFRLAGE